MSVGDFVQRKDALLVAQLKNFVLGCEQFASNLGLDDDDLAIIATASRQFQNELEALVTAKALYEAQVARKDDQKHASVQVLRQYVRQFKANPAVSTAVLERLGVVRSRSLGPLVPVSWLTVRGEPEGVNRLTYDRNGNGPGTIFVVEYSIWGRGSWEFAGVTTRRRFAHTGVVVGQPMSYRVTSCRGDQSSVPTPSATVYTENHPFESKPQAA